MACKGMVPLPADRLTAVPRVSVQGRVSGLSIPWWMTDQRRKELMADAASAGGDTEKAEQLEDPSRWVAGVWLLGWGCLMIMP